MEPTKFLFVPADTARIGDVAQRVHEEGHDVKHYIEADSHCLRAWDYLGPADE
ncbi:hypothetical protein [Halobacterium sp. KA-6]|uniref:hypothetical protein n=1 Tax=Halobacterium sp. KA-6 TaxID=2896368 RepID=UPI001E516BC0|nr:hypothetical protein [Halobacterium sp. KA-6]MCD2202265.1 hypothetical protein [Halobacterium sp. KA-6]